MRLVPLVLRLAACVKADAATLLTAAGVLGLLNNLLALLATRELVLVVCVKLCKFVIR